MPLNSQWKKNVAYELEEGGFTSKTHKKGKPQTNSTKGDDESN